MCMTNKEPKLKLVSFNLASYLLDGFLSVQFHPDLSLRGLKFFTAFCSQ